MPELNNTFVKGRMNKDLDDRLVPQGEYRDALNVEVSTSESSDVGTIQNIKGNKNLSSDIFSSINQGNLYTTINSSIYESNNISDPYANYSIDGSNIVTTGDNSYSATHSTLAPQPFITIKKTFLEVGKYYTVTLNFTLDLKKYRSNSFTYYVGIIGLTEFSDSVQIDDNGQVIDGVVSGSLVKTFYCENEDLSIYVSSNFSGDIKNINVIDSTYLQSTTENAITVGSKVDTANDVIYNFVSKASDFKLNTYTTSTGEVKSRMLGIQSDCIIQHAPNTFEESSKNRSVLTDVYKVRVGPRIGNSQKLPMIDLNGNPTLSEITGLPYVIGSDGKKYVQGIRPGMNIKFLGEDNIDLWEGLDIKVIDVGYDSQSNTGRVFISQCPPNVYFNQQAIDLNFILEFNSPRILNFISGSKEKELNTDNEITNTPIGTSITSINIVDNYIYYTDNRTEPKKINITHGLKSTKNIFEHTEYNELNSLTDSKYYLEEKYITVIKAKPTHAPKISMSNSNARAGGGLINIETRPTSQIGPSVSFKPARYSDITSSVISIVNNNTDVSPFNFFDSNDNLNSIGTTSSIYSSVVRVNWRVGDTLILTGNTSNQTVEVRIVEAFENNNNYNKFRIKVVSYSSGYSAITNPVLELFTAELKPSKVLYEDNFVSFALRYKYNDNEYSAIGPHSETAFLPSKYSYKAGVGFNESMVNSLASLDIYDIVSESLPKDVKSIDIILKDHFTTNSYIVKNINKKSSEWVNNSVEVLSELRGTTIPSLQLLRVYDAVPTTAKAQEFIASRLMYGNYSEGYNMVDHGARDINFSCKTDFEIISQNANEYFNNSVDQDSSNDLIASNVPFFNPEDVENGLNTRYIHNFYQSANETWNPDYKTDYGTVSVNGSDIPINAPADIDGMYFYGSPSAGVGNGPVFSRFLIPIFPKNDHIDGNSSTTLVMPSITDNTGSSLNVGATGNYIIAGGDSHSNHYNSSDIINYAGTNLSIQVKPLIYKVPQTGFYKIKASTKALVRYYYGNSNNGMPDCHSNPQYYKDMKFRIELHKVNANGESLGIIQDSTDLIGSQDGLAVSNLKSGDSSGSFVGSSVGPDTLHQTRTGNLIFDNGDEINIAKPAIETEFYREVSLTQDEYIAVFFSYQTSYYLTQHPSNLQDIDNVIGNPYSNSALTVTNSISDSSSIRFLLDADETRLEVTAPEKISGIQIESPSKSVRSNRFYETGVVYSDKYGRETTVMISKDSKIEIPISYSDKKNALTCEITSNAPYWATHYKYYVKESSNKYYNLILDACYNNDGTEFDDSNYAWLAFNSTDISKVNVEDNLILKKQHGTNKAVNTSSTGRVNRIKVLDISTTIPSDATSVSDSDAEGKFFIKVKRGEIAELTSATDFFSGLADNDTTTFSDNGAVFEVEPDSVVRDGFYWETSKAYPIILNTETALEYIEPGDYMQIMYKYKAGKFEADNAIANFNLEKTLKVQSVQAALSFPNNISTDRVDQTCNITFDTNVNFDVPPCDDSNSPHIILKFIKKGGNYVTARAVEMSGNVVRVFPYTHPTNRISSSILNKIALPWHNCYQWYNGVETDIIRDDFAGNTLFAYTPETGKQSGFNASDYYPDYKKITNKSDIIYSQIYNAQSNIDASNQFILADKITKRLNRSHGQINALIARNNDIIALCEDKVLKILSSGKDALFNADGNIQLTASSNVLGQSIPFAGDFGCQHPESIALDEYRIYFADKARGSVLRLSRDGITEISSNGMDNWFDEHFERAQSIIGSFDDDKTEYNITIHEVTSSRVNKNVYTLSFDESTNGWTSFKSFIKESGVSLNNKYYTFKNGEIYRHHSDDVLRNNFYGKQYNSTVTTLLNMNPNIVKSFKTVSYEGSQAEVIKDLSDSNYRNILSSKGWSVETIKTDQQVGEVDEFVEKEGKWFNNIKGK